MATDTRARAVCVVTCVFAISAGLLGCIGLFAWLTGNTVLASFYPEYIPMAPNTAVGFILLSVALCACAGSSLFWKRLARGFVVFILLITLVRLFELMTGIEWGIDWLFISKTGVNLAGVPLGQMAFATALAFLLDAVAILLVPYSRSKVTATWIPLALAGFTFSISSMILLGYLYGRPLGYGTTTIPMAMPTSIAFFMLSAGIITWVVGREMVERAKVIEKIQEADVVLKEENDKFRDLERTKSLFLSMTTHELMTPLVPMRLGLQLMLDDTRDKKNKKTINIVLRNLLRLSNLIKDLLDVTRIDAKRLTIAVSEQSLRSIIKQVVIVEKAFAKEAGVRLSVSLPPLPKLPLDKDRITQVLFNLINNAIKHSGTKDIRISARQDGDFVVVSVADGGKGIAPEDTDRLFTPFYSITKPYRGKGAGLGLYVCRGIVEAHGGSIWVESKINEGTTFSFSLPMHQQSMVTE